MMTRLTADRLVGRCGLVLLNLLFFAPAAVGLSPEVEAKFDKLFRVWMIPRTPGGTVGIFHRGEIVYAKAFGIANLDDNVPATPNTVFDLASVSKQFTATAIVLLNQRGMLSLDDDVRKFIPELPSYGRTITLRHLLHHTSGLRDYATLLSLRGTQDEAVMDNRDALEMLCRQKRLNFDPGEKYVYCNSGYMLLALIVERTSHQSMRQFLAESIFRPLDMSTALVHDDHAEVIPHRAIGYALDGRERFRIDTSNWMMTGDGAVFATIKDFAKWDRNFYDGKVGGPAWREQMLGRGKLNDGTDLDYALGLVIDRFRGLERVHHSGQWEGYRSTYVRFPKQEMSIVILSNLGSFDPDAAAASMAEILFPGELAPASEKNAAIKRLSVTDTSLDNFVGRYETFSPRFTVRITKGSNDLIMEVSGPPAFHIVPVGTNQFATGDGKARMQFERDTNNLVTSLTVFQGKDVFVLWKIGLALPSTVGYEGKFFSDELDVRYAILLRDGELVVKRGRDEARLLPLLADATRFVGSQWWAEQIHFRQDSTGAINGFALTVGQQRDLDFKKN
jgi:CubicO group peptidase (beta-lactamase class C family)